MRAQPWWEERIIGAFMAYWIYQHLGNLSPPELAEERLFGAGARRRGRRPAAARVRAHVPTASRPRAGGPTTATSGARGCVVVDSRAARVLADGRRDMVDDEEWDWIAEHARGDFDHLIIASTLPVFMPPAIHHLEAWNEAVCDGRLGRPRRAARRALRRARRPRALAGVPAARSSTMVELLRDARRAARGGARRRRRSRSSAATCTPPTSPRSTSARDQASRVYQVVCSPFRNPLSAARAARRSRCSTRG